MDNAHSHGVRANAAQAFVAGCFAGTTTMAVLMELSSVEIHITFEENRSLIAQAVLREVPAAVLLPLTSRDGTSCVPLVARLREELAHVPIVVVAPARSSSAGLAAAIRAGAHVALYGAVADLRSLLVALSRTTHYSVRDRNALQALLAGVEPASLLEVLLCSVRHAHRALTVPDLCRRTGIAPRTLSRLSQRAGWPPPAELIEWGRLLRASLLRWRESTGLAALAHASGFRSASSLAKSVRRRLGSNEIVAQQLSPLNVGASFRRRIPLHAYED